MSFTTSRVTRESLVQRSVLEFVKSALFTDRGYPPDRIEFLPSFKTDLFAEEIAKTYVAEGFHLDDGGHPAELGSTLRRKQYQFEYWVIGLNAAQGMNVAAAIQESIEASDVIPLLDYRDPAHPAIDSLLVDPVRKERVAVADPLAWQEHLYQLVIPVTDEFYP